MSGKKDSPDPLKDNHKRFNSLEWLQTSTESLCCCLPPHHRKKIPLSCGKCKFFFCLIQGRSAKFWGRSKAILPQSGVAIICKRPQDRIRLFDPTNAPRPRFLARQLARPSASPNFRATLPLPSLSTSVWKEQGGEGTTGVAVAHIGGNHFLT